MTLCVQVGLGEVAQEMTAWLFQLTDQIDPQTRNLTGGLMLVRERDDEPTFVRHEA
jgi:hypothetical protein